MAAALPAGTFQNSCLATGEAELGTPEDALRRIMDLLDQARAMEIQPQSYVAVHPVYKQLLQLMAPVQPNSSASTGLLNDGAQPQTFRTSPPHGSNSPHMDTVKYSTVPPMGEAQVPQLARPGADEPQVIDLTGDDGSEDGGGGTAARELQQPPSPLARSPAEEIRPHAANEQQAHADSTQPEHAANKQQAHADGTQLEGKLLQEQAAREHAERRVVNLEAHNKALLGQIVQLQEQVQKQQHGNVRPQHNEAAPSPSLRPPPLPQQHQQQDQVEGKEPAFPKSRDPKRQGTPAKRRRTHEGSDSPATSDWDRDDQPLTVKRLKRRSGGTHFQHRKPRSLLPDEDEDAGKQEVNVDSNEGSSPAASGRLANLRSLRGELQALAGPQTLSGPADGITEPSASSGGDRKGFDAAKQLGPSSRKAEASSIKKDITNIFEEQQKVVRRLERDLAAKEMKIQQLEEQRQVDIKLHLDVLQHMNNEQQRKQREERHLKQSMGQSQQLQGLPARGPSPTAVPQQLVQQLQQAAPSTQVLPLPTAVRQQPVQQRQQAAPSTQALPRQPQPLGTSSLAMPPVQQFQPVQQLLHLARPPQVYNVGTAAPVPQRTLPNPPFHPQQHGNTRTLAFDPRSNAIVCSGVAMNGSSSAIAAQPQQFYQVASHPYAPQMQPLNAGVPFLQQSQPRPHVPLQQILGVSGTAPPLRFPQ